jgi:adenine-specific DNA-methyltransferase
MGLLNEIFHAVYILFQASPDVVGEEWGMEEWKPNVVKKNIIQNSIYGVDIEKGAVDIARLRFWLSLIVDEPEPEALPNLDYKIVVGNSLVSKLGDEVIDIDWNLDDTSHGLFGAGLAQRKADLLRRISMEQTEFFNPIRDKKKLATDIRNLKIDLLINQLELMINTKGIHTLPTFTSKKLTEQTELYLQTLGWENSINQLHELKTKQELPFTFFDWKLDFPEVLNEKINKKVGFDIIIANPPYLKERDNSKIFTPVNKSKLGKLYHQGKMDFWYYFLHLAIDISSPKSTISFITSRYWINSQGAKKLIERVKENLSFSSVVDIGKLKVFDNVAGHHMIHTYSKNKRRFFKYKKIVNNIKAISQNENNEDVLNKLLGNEDVFLNSEIIFSTQDFENNYSNTIGNQYDLSQGVVEAADKVSSKQYKKVGRLDVNVGDGIFVINEIKLKSLDLNEHESKFIEKYLDPNDIQSYKIEPKGKKFLIYSDGNAKKLIENDKNYSTIKSHLVNYKEFITSSNGPFGIHRPREERYFKSKKILFKGMFDKNEFAIDEDQHFVGMSFISIIEKIPNKGYTLEYLLGILNSKFASNWFLTYGKKRGIGVDIGVEKLRNFPLPNKPNHNLEKLVKQIISEKKNGAPIENLEFELNKLIFKHFDLKYTEVKAIDSEFSLSEEEYKAISID